MPATPLTSITVLGREWSLPLQFDNPLPFNDDDKAAMPWLKARKRYYGIYEELGQGGRAIAFKGYISDENGNRMDNTKTVVIKIPNLDGANFTVEQITEYLTRQQRESGREWKLTRARLHECKYANPIFDLHIFNYYYRDVMQPIPVTVQFMLEDCLSLDEYLVHINQRKGLPEFRMRQILNDSWSGINAPDVWVALAKSLAVGLTDIHQRRVMHGDIWPPNIFFNKNSTSHEPVFIDFGEAFPIEPKGETKSQRDHAYRAPERSGSQHIVTKQADVYSYGKLLLYLAIGYEPILSKNMNGWERRQFVRDEIIKHNPSLTSENPFIVDVICKCISLDPVDRPGMEDIVGALNSYVDVKNSVLNTAVPIAERLEFLKQVWEDVTGALAKRDNNVGLNLQKLVELRIRDLEDIIKSLEKDVIILNDTRERLLSVLIGLFQLLQKGDRFISLTSPHMWQSSALGLDGRYLTASGMAVFRQGASVQRTFVFSIQEIGSEWAFAFAKELRKLNHVMPLAEALRFAELVEQSAKDFMARKYTGTAADVPEEVQAEAQRQLTKIIKSYMDLNKGICRGKFDANHFESFEKASGLYIGLLPVSTIDELATLKAAHPASIFNYRQAAPNDQYLLMSTDCIGRNVNGIQGAVAEKQVNNKRTRPELRRIMVYKSVFGIPSDLIKNLEQIFKQSVNVGPWTEQLVRIMTELLPGKKM